MALYATSDLHFEHASNALRRGFPTTEAHDFQILSNIADTLTKGDTLWILGDISSGSSGSERRALSLLNELTPYFDLHLTSGNHDSCHPMHIGANIRQGAFLEVFTSVQERMRRRVPTRRDLHIWFNHFPYHGDGDRNSPIDRYPDVRLNDSADDYLVHGHLHTTQKWTAPRSLHVGLDAWDLHPVPLDTINAMILEREQELSAA